MTLQADSAQLRNVAAGARMPLRQIIQEVLAVVPRVRAFTNNPGHKYCTVYYDQVTKQPTHYTINYEDGDLGNLVHELTHVRCNEVYALDSLNYVSPNRNATDLPDRVLLADGRCQNEQERHHKLRDPAKDVLLATQAQQISAWANAANELSAEQKQKIVNQIMYLSGKPFMEFDTVMNQILVWLHEWGWPQAYTGAKPVANALYEEVEKIVAYQYRRRQLGLPPAPPARAGRPPLGGHGAPPPVPSRAGRPPLPSRRPLPPLPKR